jgi:hypothetical protein
MTPLVLALSLLMAGPSTHAAKPISAVEVARRLDMNTFTNSTGWRHTPGARTLRDYGFTRVEPEGPDYPNSVSVYEADSTWVFWIQVLSWTGRKGILCIQDKPMISGTYNVMRPVEVEEGRDGLLRATGRAITHPECVLYEN